MVGRQSRRPRLRTRGGRVEGRRPLRETLVGTLRQQGSPPEEIAGTVRSCRPRTEGSWSRFRGGGVLGGPGQGLEGNKDFHRPRLASHTALPRPDFLLLLRMKACIAQQTDNIRSGNFTPLVRKNAFLSQNFLFVSRAQVVIRFVSYLTLLIAKFGIYSHQATTLETQF